jgi:fibronectin-binding autotransporter adhesin
VAGGDWNLDGYGDVVIAPDKGSAHPVVAYSGFNGAQLWSYSPFGTTYTGGVSIALGDVNGDGYLDLISGELSTGSKVQVNLNNKTGGITTATTYRTITATLPLLYNTGVTVAAGNLNGSSTASIIVGSNSSAGHESLVQVYNGGANGGLVYSFAPYSTYSLGVRVATEDLGGTEDMVIAPVTASSSTLFGNPTVLVLKGNLAGVFTETLNDAPFQGGVFVG